MARQSDSTRGGDGNDTFVFDVALKPENIDPIIDFDVAADTIRLDHAIFTNLALGTLSASAFFVGSAAHDADDRIIYDNTNGKLIYDSNGNAAGGAVQFAYAGGVSFTNADFVVT